MKKVKYFGIILLLFSLHNNGVGQRNNVWCFGDSLMMDFSSGTPLAATTKIPMIFLESGASISDLNGNLLFYGNEERILNRNNLLMENGNGLDGFSSCTQGVLILPFPGDSNKYYYFHLGSPGAFYQMNLYYSVIDLNFNGGLGRVVQKNIVIYSDSLTEKLMAVKHSNGNDWWLLAHEYYNDRFVKFLVTDQGIFGPTFQDIGSIHGNPSYPLLWSHGGEMTFSQDGQKLAIATAHGLLDLFDFDRCNGIISNQIAITNIDSNGLSLGDEIFYGCSFSPDGNLLYVTAGDTHFAAGTPNLDFVFQFDLNASNIYSSKTTLHIGDSLDLFGQIEIGPDNKVYISVTGDSSLISIETPNQIGISCNLILQGVSGFPTYTLLNLPNLPNYNLGPIATMIAEAGQNYTICEGDSIPIGIPDTSGGKCTFAWTNGTTLTNSSISNPYAFPTTTTTYYLTVEDTTYNSPCALTLDSVTITVIPSIEFPIAFAGNDSTLCPGDSIRLGIPDSSGGNWIYSWSPSNGLNDDSIPQPWLYPAPFPFQYILTVSHSSGASCAIAEDTVEVLVISDCGYWLPGLDIYPNPFIDELTIRVIDPDASQIDISIYNTLGQLLLEESLPVEDGLTVVVDTEKLAAGMYIVKAEAGSQLTTERVVKISP